MTYLSFLQALLTLGTEKLPRVLEFLQAEGELLAQFADLLGGSVVHNSPATTAEEMNLEEQLISSSHVHGKFGDGTIIRGLFTLISAHPELLTVFLGLLKK